MSDADWEQLRARAGALVDGVAVPPELIAVDQGQHHQGGDTKRMELAIPSRILRHELKEAQAIGPDDDLKEFVQRDCSEHGPTAWSAYLTILQHVVTPSPPRRSGWFSSLLRKPKPPQVPPAQYAIVGVDAVREDEAMLLLEVLCRHVA